MVKYEYAPYFQIIYYLFYITSFHSSDYLVLIIYQCDHVYMKKYTGSLCMGLGIQKRQADKSVAKDSKWGWESFTTAR